MAEGLLIDQVTDDGIVAAWRRGGVLDRVFGPA